MSPDTAAFHWGLCSVYIHQPRPDYQGAITAFRRVIDLEPEWVEGYHCIAWALEASGDLDGSIRYYAKAIELAPEDSRPVIAYGVCLTKLGRFEEAIGILRHGIKLRPHYGEASAHLFLADAHLGIGNIAAACREWQFVLTLEATYPENGSAHQSAREMLARHRC